MSTQPTPVKAVNPVLTRQNGLLSPVSAAPFLISTVCCVFVWVCVCVDVVIAVGFVGFICFVVVVGFYLFVVVFFYFFN
jgi:hypothetical protein